MALLGVGFGLAHAPDPSRARPPHDRLDPEPLRFSTPGPKSVVADSCGGRLTTDAGALLLREVADRLGLLDARDAAIPDPRHPTLIVQDQRSLLAQRVTAIALGSEDLNDHQTLRADPALQRAAGRVPEEEWTLASPPTLCRLEDRIDRTTLIRIAEVPVDQFLAAHPEPPGHLTLDFDATDDPTHGQQEDRSFHGYYDRHCSLPLYVFCGDELLVADLRPSTIADSKHARAVLKLLVRRLRAAWPEVKVTIRADSGFCRWRLMRWCDAQGIGSVLGPARNPALERAARGWTEQAGRQFGRTGRPQRLLGSFASAAGSWERRRRVIVTAEHTARGADPWSLVTDVPGDPRDFYEDVYCRRGEAENRIKEQQLDLFADRTSCHRFLANQFRRERDRGFLDRHQRRAAIGSWRTNSACSSVRRLTCWCRRCDGRPWRGPSWRGRRWARSGCGCSRWRRGWWSVRVGWCSIWPAAPRPRRCFERCPSG